MGKSGAALAERDEEVFDASQYITAALVTPKKGNLRVLHVGDLHFGRAFADFTRTNSATGLSLMHEDQLEAFRKIVSIAIENDVAVVIFPGDFYDRVSNVAEKLQFSIQQELLRLTRSGIATIILLGNHDIPRSRDFKALIARYDGIGEYINVVPVYKGKYEAISINDEILVHALPFCFSREEFREQFELIRRDPSFKVNIFAAHTSIQGAGIDAYEHNLDEGNYENREPWLKKAEINDEFDYVALGDYHKPFKVTPKAYYAGALVPQNFGEKDFKHLVMLFDGKDGSKTPIMYNTRGMSEFTIECEGLSNEEVNKKLAEIRESFVPENYTKIVFNNISKEQRRNLDYQSFMHIKSKAFYCSFQYMSIVEEEQEVNINSEIKPIKDEMFEEIDMSSFSEEKKRTLKELYLFISEDE